MNRQIQLEGVACDVVARRAGLLRGHLCPFAVRRCCCRLPYTYATYCMRTSGLEPEWGVPPAPKAVSGTGSAGATSDAHLVAPHGNVPDHTGRATFGATRIAPTFEADAGSLTARILFTLSDDPARPTRLKQVVMALPSARLKSVGDELADLVARGAVARVRKGVYVRLVGPVAGGCS